MHKFIVFVLSSFIFCNCHNRNAYQQPDNKVKKIFSAELIPTSCIAFQHNSISILTLLTNSSDDTVGAEYAYDSYTLEKKNDTFLINTFMEKMGIADGKILKEKMKKSSLFISDPLDLEIKYVKTDIGVENAIRKQALNCEEILCQQRGNLYYMVCKGTSKYFYIYDASSKQLYTQTVIDIPVKLRDFLLYDVTGDNVPELILFTNSSKIRQHPIINVDICSIALPNSV